jgi:putative transposase
MEIRKAYKFQLKLTKKQARLLAETLDECRWLYNQLLEYRKLAYEELDISLTKYQQLMLLPLLKEERQTLDSVHSQVLQDVVQRLDRAFEGFFRRCKESKEKPGYPRFRGTNRYTSFTYPQSGFALRDNKLYLSKVGALRIKQHRSLEGEVKICSLQREANGAWYVIFSCMVSATPQRSNDKAVGVDLGIEHFATLSDGQVIDNPRFFKKEEKAIAKIQRKLSKEKKGSVKRRKLGKQAAKIHRRIRNKRSDFCHKAARKLVQEYQYKEDGARSTKAPYKEHTRCKLESILPDPHLQSGRSW